MSRKEAVATTLEDASEMLQTILDFLESDTRHLEDMGVQKKVAKFPWGARNQAVTEIMVAVEGLRNRMLRIEGR